MTEECRITEGHLIGSGYRVHELCGGWGCHRCGGHGAVRVPEVEGWLTQADYDQLMADLSGDGEATTAARAAQREE